MSYKSYKLSNKKGGYESLIVYWLGMTIYDLTVIFCKTYKSYLTYKTYEQMTGAARSGKQNIVEGSLENSVEGNLKLTGIAKASYGELLEDYKDFLRQNNLPVWDNNSEGFANLLITLSYKQSFLLSKLLKRIEEKFVQEGGFRENLFRKRKEFLKK